ncbi:hypothetical protein DESACE_08930 [Desulfurella acetivorans A63]|nr:hypothetical protein DESACE_08930 [Desulfurella acetivorans A63]
MTQENPTIQRLEDQIDWYDRKSNINQKFFHWLKIIEIIIAAFIPFLSGVSAPAILTGSAGVLIVVLEGLQHLFQFQHNWITYRSTCENLKHEKYLWLAKSGPYADAENPDVLLADRIESLISQEHAKWIAGQEKVGQLKR